MLPWMALQDTQTLYLIINKSFINWKLVNQETVKGELIRGLVSLILFLQDCNFQDIKLPDHFLN